MAVTASLPTMLDQYHVAWTLFAAKSPVATLMDYLTGRKCVYTDDTAVIHIGADSTR